MHSDGGHSSLKLEELSDRLWLSPEGFYRAPDSGEEVSFPSEDFAECLRLEQNSFWFSHRGDCIVQAVRQHLRGGWLLDVGGGNGYVAWRLRQAGIEAALLEPGEGACLNGLSRGLPYVVRANLAEANFHPESVPAVGLFDVIEHVENQAELLAEIHRVLAPGGLVFLTVPAYQWLWSSNDEVAGHFRRYTLRSLSGVLEENNFQPLYGSYIFSFLPLPILVGRVIRFRLGAVPNSKDRSREHKPNKLVMSVVRGLCQIEYALLQRGHSVPFGASCLMVAKKLNRPA